MNRRRGKGEWSLSSPDKRVPATTHTLAKDFAEQGYYAVLVDGNDFWIKGGGGEIKGGGGEALLKGVITRSQQSPHALPGKVAVVGFSLGGASTLTYATRMPELVSAVVVCYPRTDYITNPDNFVSKIKVPTLMLAGGRDTYIIAAELKWPGSWLMRLRRAKAKSCWKSSSIPMPSMALP